MSDKNSNTHCEICHKSCNHDKGEDEVCSNCGLVVCQEHVVLLGERPFCQECAKAESQRKTPMA